ncbi:cytochrome P450 [Diaporthe helianthi]|uniref:Cytochrome P450 n=1 Tax=Diaporthe helianthi TaxID=158607 RepID=A0A2P5HFE6_DIAHE|nr:cytochrome P450 [Diaporthe helianthi]
MATHASSAISIVLLSGFAYLLGRAIYNVFFHPLRKFPGPKTMAWGRLPWTATVLGGKPYQKLLDLHDKYGPIVRIADNELSIIHPDAWKDVYGHRKGGGLENTKDPFVIMGNEHNLLGANIEDHSRFRRVLSHGFSMQAIAEQQPRISTHIDLLFQRLHEQCDQGKTPMDLVTWYNRVTFDVISDMTWGEPLGSLEKSQDHPWIHAMEVSTKGLNFIGQTKRFPAPLTPIFEKLIPKEVKRLTRDNFMYAAINVEKRIELGESRPDFMEAMLRQKGERAISKEEQVANAFIIMLGGSETSSTALAAAVYYLLKSPEAFSKLTAEILSAFQTESDINVHNIQNLPYLTAVMEETLRVHPPLPNSSPRLVHEGGRVICGEFIPEGTGVSIPHWAMYHSTENFSLPHSFIPERWLGDPRFDNDRREARKPFAIGPRNCIGMNLATTEIRIILARTIWNFEMRLAEDSKNWGESQKAFVLWEKPALNVYMTPRNLPR